MTRLRQFSPMPVERVADTESSSHIEPACHWWWPPSRRLAWQTGVTLIDTGLRIDVSRRAGDLRTNR